MVRSLTIHENFINSLFGEVAPENRCPHIRKDDSGAYCANGLKVGEPVSDSRRMVCDHYSLQLWCLSKKDYKKCIYFYEGKF